MGYIILPESILQEGQYGTSTKQSKNPKPQQAPARAAEFSGKSGERWRNGVYRYFAAGSRHQRRDYRADQILCARRSPLRYCLRADRYRQRGHRPDGPVGGGHPAAARRPDGRTDDGRAGGGPRGGVHGLVAVGGQRADHDGDGDQDAFRGPRLCARADTQALSF